MQTELNFLHTIENNPDSTSFLNENKVKLSKECSKIYDLLKQGRQLSVKECVVENITQSLPRRILDSHENRRRRIARQGQNNQ